MSLKVLFRVDFSVAIGSGHLSRCLALAEEFIDSEVQVFFLGSFEKESWIYKAMIDLQIMPISCKEREIPKRLIYDISPNLIIFDGYHFSSTEINEISEKYKTLMLVDETETKVISSFYLNQNIGAAELGLNIETFSRGIKLLGPKYALIRKNILEVRKKYNPRNSKSPIVTCFLGGTAFSNLIVSLAEFLNNFQTGPTFNLIASKKFHDKISESIINHKINLIEPNSKIHEILASSDFVICGAGVSVLEMACIGIPSAFVPVAENQLTYANNIAETLGATILHLKEKNADCENRLALKIQECINDYGLRNEFYMNSRTIVDGLGKSRLLEEIL